MTIIPTEETGIETAWGRKETAGVQNSPIRELLWGHVDHILTEDATADPRFAFPGVFCAPIHDHNLRARVHAPLVVAGDIIGALSISSFAPGRYGPRDVAAARYVADLISPYLFALREAERSRQAAIVETEARAREEGLRLGARDLTQALEQERQRIGMDLHDQTLADLSRLMRDLSRPGALDAETVLARLDDCVADLRRIIDTAVPSILDMFGFAHAVRVHLERAAGGAQVEVQDDSQGAPDALDPVAAALELEVAEGPLAGDPERRLAEPAQLGRHGVEDLEGPPFRLGVAAVHLRQVAREQGGLVAAFTAEPADAQRGQARSGEQAHRRVEEGPGTGRARHGQVVPPVRERGRTTTSRSGR